MARIQWTDRKFDFNFPAELYPELIERLRGTPARVEDRIRGLPSAALMQRDGDRWSIQENIGHLLDLEELFTGRLDDFDRGLPALRAADMTNRKTHEASHNERNIDDLLKAFRSTRAKMIDRLERSDSAYFSRTALHPRLNKPMRVTDMLYFQAEHDDFHLARITELLRQFRPPA
jgi:uncharacterized damage-inducible protein DinB